MPFDLSIFEAEIALNLIPTERLPSFAREALESGCDGPRVVRMAILEPHDDWAIDEALGPMLAELGCHPVPLEEAALLLARLRAQRILESGEDPLPSLPYFHRLMMAADRSIALYELAYLEDDFYLLADDDVEERQRLAREALAILLSPELQRERQARWEEQQKLWESERQKAKLEWPYVLNSPTGRALFKERNREKLVEMKPFLWIELVAWVVTGWAFSSWRTAVIGYFASLALIPLLGAWGIYVALKRERRRLLRTMRVPEEEI